MCLRPSEVWQERGPGFVQVPVKCGHCWQCRRDRVNDYVGRCLCEASVSDWTLVLTLTYAPDFDEHGEPLRWRRDGADKVITPLHFQRFIRAVRKRGHFVRYLAAGEYGEAKGRAHFHVCLFGKGEPLKIPLQQNTHRLDLWPHGHIWADGIADEKTLRYVCKYLLKKDMSYQEYKEHWITCSKKPPLGDAFFDALAARNANLQALPASFSYVPPGSNGGVYRMTGATRREYLRRLCERMTVKREALNEWAQMSLDKLDRWEREKEFSKRHPDEKVRLRRFAEFCELLLAEIDSNRPSELAWARKRFIEIADRWAAMEPSRRGEYDAEVSETKRREARRAAADAFAAHYGSRSG